LFEAVGSYNANSIAVAIEFDLKKDGKFYVISAFHYYSKREIEGTINSDSDAETGGFSIKNIQIDQCSSIGQCFLNMTL
jgi:hypothetical protein